MVVELLVRSQENLLDMLGIPPEIWCVLFGHRFKENQPKKLMNSPHRRLECQRKSCGIMKWRFSANTQEEIDEIEHFIQAKPVNRSQRRAAKV